MSVLIGLHGPRGSGKNTVAGLIEKWAAGHGVSARSRGFADVLKLSVYRNFKPDCTTEEAILWADFVKMQDNRCVVLIAQANSHGWVNVSTHLAHLAAGAETGDMPDNVLAYCTGTELFQRTGTEGHREVAEWGPDFWVDTLLPNPQDSEIGRGAFLGVNFDGADVCLVTDLRFENEADRVHGFGCEVWYIDRPDALGTGNVHISEKKLPDEKIDRVIRNDAGLSELEGRVNEAMNQRYRWLIHSQS